MAKLNLTLGWARHWDAIWGLIWSRYAINSWSFSASKVSSLKNSDNREIEKNSDLKKFRISNISDIEKFRISKNFSYQTYRISNSVNMTSDNGEFIKQSLWNGKVARCARTKRRQLFKYSISTSKPTTSNIDTLNRLTVKRFKHLQRNTHVCRYENTNARSDSGKWRALVRSFGSKLLSCAPQIPYANLSTDYPWLTEFLGIQCPL